DILKNGDFETGDTSSWVPMWDATTVMVAGHDSQYAAEVTATLWNSLAQEIRVEKNKEYTISFWAKKGSGAPNVSVLVKDVAGNQNINQAHMNNVTEEWEQFSFTFNAGECTNPTVLIMANADTGTIVVDDIVITKNEAEEPEDPETPDGSRVIIDEGFESGVLNDQWPLGTAGTSGISESAAKDGKYGFLISGVAWDEILFSKPWAIEGGVTYTITFDVKGSKDGARMNFQIKNCPMDIPGNGNSIVNNYLTLTADWQTLTYTFAKDSSIYNPGASLLFVGQGDDFYIDNISVTAASPSGMLTNGGFETGDGSSWILGANSTVVAGEQTHDGVAALKTNENGSSILMASQSVQLTPNTDYVVTGWFYFYGNVDTNPAYFFNVEGATPDYAWEYGTFKDRNDNRQYVNGAANAWVMTRLKFNSGDTGVVNVSLVNYRTDGGQYYFDDFKLVEYDESDYDGSGYVGNSNQEKAEGADIRVMSYNVLMDNAEYGGINWGQPMDKPFSGTGTRDGNAAIMIGHYAPDVIGFQEFSYNWYQGIRTALPQYEFVNDVDPESGNEDFMCTALAYNTETVELVESRLFKNTKTRWGVLRFRYVNAGIFRLKATGQMFIVTSLHPDAGEVNGDGLHRPHQLKEDAEFIKALEEEFRVPVISTGDYNSGSSADEFQTFMEITGMRDSNTKNGGSVIDHVMINSYVQSLYATTVTDAIAAGASDHLAVFSDLKLLDGASYSIDAILNNIKTQGRTEMVDGTLMLDWSISGIEFKANCSGTVKATFNAKKIGDTTAQGGVYFTIVVDGVAKDRAYCHITKAGETEIVLAEGLAAGEHTFAIYRQTEHLYGEVGISSISLDGTLAAKPADSDLYIEFIGDSITAAYGCLSNDVNQKDPGKPLYSDATQGYAYLTAKALGADWSSVAWSGLGCKYGYSSTTMQQVYPMQRYNYDKNTAYDFSARVPDIIVFALGTNDDAIQKDAALRKAGMVEMLNLVREKNPGVKIVWIYNMMTSGINKQIEEIINEMGGEEAGLYSLKLTMNTSGGGWHPNLAGQKKFADDLTAFIQTTFMKPPKQVTGMSIVTEPTKTQYQIGDKLDTTGLVLELTYDDGSTEQVTEGFTTRGFQSVTAGKRKVTVVYGDFSDSYQYEVVDNETPVDPPVDPPIDPPVDPAKNGWVEEDGKWAYYVDDVKVVNKWMLDSVGWCYLGADGYCVTNKWVADSKGWCYLDDNGRMVTNKWVMDSVGWCYVGADGYCVTNKWVADSKGWCYLDDQGRMATNRWIMDSVGWCYVGADGYCVTNKWVADSKGWCYLDDQGRMVTNKWVKDSVGWCYIGEAGYCLTNAWVKDSVGWCYLDANGRMVYNTTVDGYYVNADGYRVG
ncbi:MAG: carbohydrate binding domain-containing protein, partial [Clostridia bacterium]|nr:carbohydrate binding domain-containing protein [Clostridia bacterium]